MYYIRVIYTQLTYVLKQNRWHGSRGDGRCYTLVQERPGVKEIAICSSHFRRSDAGLSDVARETLERQGGPRATLGSRHRFKRLKNFHSPLLTRPRLAQCGSPDAPVGRQGTGGRPGRECDAQRQRSRSCAGPEPAVAGTANLRRREEPSDVAGEAAG